MVEVAIAVAGGAISAPIVLYLNHVFSQWLPGGRAADQSRIQRLQAELAIQGNDWTDYKRLLSSAIASMKSPINLTKLSSSSPQGKRSTM